MAAVAASIVVIVLIVVVVVNNTASAKLNRAIKNDDIDEAANYYLDKFEENGKDISDKTLELLKEGIAQIETDYQAGDLTADEAYEKLVAYRLLRKPVSRRSMMLLTICYKRNR